MISSDTAHRPRQHVHRANPQISAGYNTSRLPKVRSLEFRFPVVQQRDTLPAGETLYDHPVIHYCNTVPQLTISLPSITSSEHHIQYHHLPTRTPFYLLQTPRVVRHDTVVLHEAKKKRQNKLGYSNGIAIQRHHEPSKPFNPRNTLPLLQMLQTRARERFTSNPYTLPCSSKQYVSS